MGTLLFDLDNRAEPFILDLLAVQLGREFADIGGRALAAGWILSAASGMLVATARTSGRPMGRIALLSVTISLLTAVIALGSLEVLEGVFWLGLSAWILLPTVTGLFRPRSDKPDD